MRRNDSICPLLTIAANADASNQGTAVPCDPEHCMMSIYTVGYDCRTGNMISGYSCGLVSKDWGERNCVNVIEAKG